MPLPRLLSRWRGKQCCLSRFCYGGCGILGNRKREDLRHLVDALIQAAVVIEPGFAEGAVERGDGGMRVKWQCFVACQIGFQVVRPTDFCRIGIDKTGNVLLPLFAVGKGAFECRALRFVKIYQPFDVIQQNRAGWVDTPRVAVGDDT